ncbi:hypothetical protein [Aliarcobacter butzleri]|uniref:hypothetical protein n=1 Tax=Aliarcobacter butzleri TaxID=28197 RepID=UPI0021B3FDDC|nr:hypothetical protein [Aliarcobacter butzleri]MCT7586580.1 hypothetical protein [Aliarcobacter butzleri]
MSTNLGSFHLERYGVIVSRKRIRNILKQLGLFVKMKRRFKVMTTDSNHSLPIAPNILNRDFYASKVDEKYSAIYLLLRMNYYYLQY